MKCSGCGFDNAAGMKFCGKCGGTLALKCRSCGFESLGGMKFCGECGANHSLIRRRRFDRRTPKLHAEAPRRAHGRAEEGHCAELVQSPAGSKRPLPERITSSGPSLRYGP
jgi:hypothetical protein